LKKAKDPSVKVVGTREEIEANDEEDYHQYAMGMLFVVHVVVDKFKKLTDELTKIEQQYWEMKATVDKIAIPAYEDV
jgi:hypothetical protein